MKQTQEGKAGRINTGDWKNKFTEPTSLILMGPLIAR